MINSNGIFAGIAEFRKNSQGSVDGIETNARIFLRHLTYVDRFEIVRRGPHDERCQD